MRWECFSFFRWSHHLLRLFNRIKFSCFFSLFFYIINSFCLGLIPKRLGGKHFCRTRNIFARIFVKHVGGVTCGRFQNMIFCVFAHWETGYLFDFGRQLGSVLRRSRNKRLDGIIKIVYLLLINSNFNKIGPGVFG